MKTGVCQCAVCTARMRPARILTPMGERLRGFEFEFSAQQIAAMRCEGHLQKCESKKVWQRRHAPMAAVDCHCEVCVEEQRQQVGEAMPCDGHGCAIEGPQKWLREVVTKVKSPYPFEGVFTEWERTPRDNEYWALKTDRSCGYEIASPPVTAAQMPRIIAPVLAAVEVEEKKHRTRFTGENCGLHVTFDVQDLGLRNIKQLLYTAVKHQRAMFATQPKYRTNNMECAPVALGLRKLRRGLASSYSFDSILPVRVGDEEMPRLRRLARPVAIDDEGGLRLDEDDDGPALAVPEREVDPDVAKVVSTRKLLINLTKWRATGLVEFRFGGMTTDWKQVEAFAVLLECLIEAAIRRPTVYLPAGGYDEKRALFEEIIRPYMKEERVERAWGVLSGNLG